MASGMHKVWGSAESSSPSSLNSGEETSDSFREKRRSAVRESCKHVVFVSKSDSTGESATENAEVATDTNVPPRSEGGGGAGYRGSAEHDSGACKPCHYMLAKNRCKYGSSCIFCHAEHTKRLRPRPSKAARATVKRAATLLQYGDLGCLDQQDRKLSTKEKYYNMVMKSKKKTLHSAMLAEDGTVVAGDQTTVTGTISL